MASPAFGFSVGDCIAAIKFALDVYRACKEHGGAASKSKFIICELESYCTVLEKVQKHLDSRASSEFGDVANKLLSHCRHPLEEFRKKITKRWSGKAIVQSKPSLDGFRRNAKWVLSDASAIERLRAQIVIPINFLVLELAISLEDRFAFLTVIRRNKTDAYKTRPATGIIPTDY